MLEPSEEDEPAPDPASKELVCFALATEDHKSAVARLSSANVAIEASTAYTIYVRDPDGRRVGLSSYPDVARFAPHVPPR